MCRLFGLAADQPHDIRYWMSESAHPFVELSSYHCHGWGIGWYESGEAQLVKEPVPARESALFQATFPQVQSQTIIAHLRKASQGAHTLENTHPFTYDNWLFGHNGLVDCQFLNGMLPAESRSALRGETDSEVYFHWLLHNIRLEGAEGIRSALRAVRRRSFTAINFVLSDGVSLYAYCEQSLEAKPSHPEYYQLYWTERSRRPDQRALEGTSVVVCSERLDDALWEKIPFGSLLTVSPGPRVSILDLK
jgi:predicted glutamine amidotransferase